jgi:hypothetical protein
MFIIKSLGVMTLSFILLLIPVQDVWAWGPGVHMVVGCRILEDLSQLFPGIAGILRSFPLEYLYGSLAADFFVGKGVKQKPGHSHNWETGFKFINNAKNDREVAYALGFLSHLAADVIAHNYFIPNLIRLASTWKRMGHLYWEAKADHYLEPGYMRMANDLLKMDHLGCDRMLKHAVGKGKRGLKAKRQLFTQSVKLSHYLNTINDYQPMRKTNPGRGYRISVAYLVSMIGLSHRLVKDILKNLEKSKCLSYDPIGSRNLKEAGHHAVLSKIFNRPRAKVQFNVDHNLLEL